MANYSDKHFTLESSGGRNELFEGASPLSIIAPIHAQSEAQGRQLAYLRQA